MDAAYILEVRGMSYRKASAGLNQESGVVASGDSKTMRLPWAILPLRGNDVSLGYVPWG